MIHRIAVSNFYCVRDRLEIELGVSGQVPEMPERFAAAMEGDATRTPKVLGLFGPNASGKSTILRVPSFVTWFIQHGFLLAPKDEIPCHRFANKAKSSEPISIELEFDAPVNLTEKSDQSKRCRYVYSLVLEGGSDQPTHIAEENLSYWPPDATRRVRIFDRRNDRVHSGARAFALMGYTRSIPKVLRSNVSLISTLAQLGHEPSVMLREIASKIETNIFTERYSFPEGFVAETYFGNKRLFNDLNREISRLDLGITEVVITKASGDKRYPDPTFKHRGLAGQIPIESESEGTRQFFKVFPMIAQALHYGGVAIIDEFDSSVHALVLPEIIRWFYDPKRNARNAQLWFTGQNPYLLSALAKEQIILCEKDDYGGSTAFKLSDVKAVRRIDNYMRKYLGGAYGAVPHFG